ncbi:glutamate receptor 1-like [Cryptotermes secundus]|uniref:glutamate receptor 1-like n=1 Tax=Cryptotermes secundus TaxID=105785 RepID=UPI001454BEAF|nr:glutamate receptor 1-like [Cryptotermes secundus]
MASQCVASVEVLLALQTHFHAGCVYLMQSQNTTGVEERRFMKFMSTRGREVAASVFNEPNQLIPRTCSYNRPFHVLLSSDENTKLALSQLSSKRGVMADAVWLLFLEKSVDQFFEDVYIPVDCEFLVAQRRGGNVVLLTEIYRMDKGLPLQHKEFGIWNQSGLHASRESLVRRRSHFHGFTITATSINSPPLVLMDEEKTEMKGGLFGSVWTRLERRLNFTTRYVIPSLRSWGTVFANNTTTGVLGVLADGQAEVGVFHMIMTSRRIDVMDFSIPLLSPKFHIFVRQPDGLQLQWNTYLAPLSRTLWLTIVLLILLIALFLSKLQRLGRRHGIAEKTLERFWFRDCLFFIFGAVCQQGAEVQSPQLTSCRVVYLTTYLGAVVMLASYSATLISFLTVRTVKLPFNDIEEFLKVGTHKLGTLEHSTALNFFRESEMPLYREVYRRFLQPAHGTMVPDVTAGLTRLCSSKYALLAMYVDTVGYMEHVTCPVVSLRRSYFRSSLAFGLALNSPYKAFLNYHLLTLQNDGELYKLQQLLLAPLRQQDAEELAPVDGSVSVEIQHLLPVLTVLGAGVLLSATCFLLEWAAGRRTRSKQKTAVAV